MNSNINSEINIGYSRRIESQKYWCHICKKEFFRTIQEDAEVHCIFCNKTFCEEVDQNENDRPNNFVPYENNSNSRTTNTNNSQNLITNQDRANSGSGILIIINF